MPVHRSMQNNTQALLAYRFVSEEHQRIQRNYAKYALLSWLFFVFFDPQLIYEVVIKSSQVYLFTLVITGV
jgi:hypothetical protein